MPSPKNQRDYKLDHKLSFKTDDLVFQVHNHDVDTESNHIYLFSVDRGYDVNESDQELGVDHVLASRFIKNFNMCMRKKPKSPILIHMKICGGNWEEGMAIYDTIKSCPWPVTILNYTHARSMSSIILQAASKSVLMPNSYFMFHEGTYAMEGTIKQIRSATAFDKRASSIMLDIYTKSMKEKGEFKGKTTKQIRTWLINQMDKKEDVYLTAEQTVKYGLADEIFDYNWERLTEYS